MYIYTYIINYMHSFSAPLPRTQVACIEDVLEGVSQQTHACASDVKKLLQAVADLQAQVCGHPSLSIWLTLISVIFNVNFYRILVFMLLLPYPLLHPSS